MTKKLYLTVFFLSSFAFASSNNAVHLEHGKKNCAVSDIVIETQKKHLEENTKGKGFGPQSPRDIDKHAGRDNVYFNEAPHRSKMNLCNIHFHKNAEHKGGEFTVYAGNGDGHGYCSGYRYSGKLSESELKPVDHLICPSIHNKVISGDTIEVHYVYSTAQVSPGKSLNSCFNEATINPQLRVEAQVYVLVNDGKGLDFQEITKHDVKNGLHQAYNMPTKLGKPVVYEGSTTGPKYDEIGSPYEVTWSVYPKVAKVEINTVGEWCEGNVFEEDHAHGVRNLVDNPDLLSPIPD